MRTLKHAILSLWRKPTKALMIFLIMFIVFLLVFTGIIIQNSIDESKRHVRIELGGQVEYRADNLAFYKAQEDGEDVDWQNDMKLSTETAREIAKDSAVIDYFFVIQNGQSSNELESGDEATRKREEENAGEWEGYEPSYYFSMTGTSATIPIEFQSDKFSLVEGRHFTDEEAGKESYVALISIEVAKQNDLQLGDTIRFENWGKTDALWEEMWQKVETEGGEWQEIEPVYDEYEVVGFFEGATGRDVDRLFIPYETIKTMNSYNMYYDYETGEEREMTEDDMVSNIYFLVEDPLEVDAFIERNIEKLPSRFTTLSAGESQYEQLTKPLDLMEMIATILIWVVFVAGALIIVSIVTIFVRDRRFEVGLLLSAGESKGKIVFQFIFEILIVALLAFIIAVGVSQASSGFVADWIIENQLVETDQSESDLMLEMWGQSQIQKDVTMADIAEDFNVAMSVDIILNLLLISLGILVAASLIPLLIIVAYKPRKALQD